MGWQDEYIASIEAPLRAEIDRWKAYADKLETSLRLVADLSDDQLKRMQAAEGLRIVRPAALGE